MKSYFILTSIVIWSICCSCATKNTDTKTSSIIPYPQPLPDTTAITFLPNVVSKDGLDFNSVFSPDGKSFYFTRSANRQWDIYVTTHNGKNWSEPKLAPFSNSKFSEADPIFSPDGKLFFISNRPKQAADTLSDFDIWFIEQMPGNQWTEPKNFTQINSDSAEYYISFATNGNAYFGSSRPGGFGAEDIYVSRFVNGQYSIPENLGPSVNTKESEHDPCIWPNEEYLVFKSENQDGGYGEADLYCSKQTPDKQWTKAANLGVAFNTTTYEYCPYLTADSKYFFFSSEFDFNGFGVRCNAFDNGFIEVEATGGTDEFSFLWPALSETTPLVENLVAGMYDVIVTDSNGCPSELSYEITEPVELTLGLLSFSNITCFGGSDGILIGTAGGGFGNIEFSLNSGPWQDSPEFNSLIAGQDYAFTVRDANQCIASFAKILTQPGEIKIQFEVAPALCADPVGEVTASVSGGVGEFELQWEDSDDKIIGTTPVISNKHAGIYSLKATDQSGCVVEKAIGIPSLDGPTLAITENYRTSCWGVADGSAAITVIQGNGPFTISWEDEHEEWSRNDLSFGEHYASVTDVNSCITVVPVITESPDQVNLHLVEKVDPSCFQTCDGRISVEARGGNGGYEIFWNTLPGNNSITDLCSGGHEIRAVDQLGCSGTLNVHLNRPDELRVKSISRHLSKCYNSCDGAIEVSAVGGDGTYTYHWSAGAVTRRQENICPGSYNVSVSDGKGCELIETIILGNTTLVEASLIHVQAPVCFGNCDGVLEVAAHGGAGNHHFQWADATVAPKNSSLCAGEHTVIVTDRNNCQISATYFVPDVPELKVDIGDGVVLCAGQQHELNAGPSWQKVAWWQSGNLVSSAQKIIIIEPAEYRVDVWDDKNCKATDTFILENSDDLLQASFLLPAEALAGDTVVAIDISWPLPDNISWTFPDEMVKIRELNDVVFGKFEDAGDYQVTLHASLGLCKDNISKTITILDSNRSVSGGRLGTEDFVKSLTLHPNPNTGSFEVEVEFMEESPIEIRIWSTVTSRLVAEVSDAGQRSYRKNFNLVPISSGTYLLKVHYKGG